MDRLHPGCCLWRFAITRLLSRLERAVSSFTQVCVPGPGGPAALGLLAAVTSGHTWGSWQCGMTPEVSEPSLRPRLWSWGLGLTQPL